MTPLVLALCLVPPPPPPPSIQPSGAEPAHHEPETELDAEAQARILRLRAGGWTSIALGGVGMITGIGLIVVGADDVGSPDWSTRDKAMFGVGVALIPVGIALVATGDALLRKARKIRVTSTAGGLVLAF
ncbi:MAG: hypothetical protein HC927_00325 [Deltaproteobacteria bacterium]|nr:hypothetical protein [Deltaproteobacteria bacterium]